MKQTFRSVLRFYAVGAIGVGVQLLVLTLLRRGPHLPILAATAVAVESAVLHNFLWHERWTWAHRGLDWSGAFGRFVRFNVGNGGVSLVGNLAIMELLVSRLHAPDLPANISAIGVCSLVNFLISDRWIFSAGRRAV